jgi:tRNA threonylcarbamoyladenosine biosynthesis protein TsaB
MKQSSAEDAPASLVLVIEASSRTYAVAAGDGTDPLVQAAARRDDPGFAGLGELAAGALAQAGAVFGDIATIGVDVGPGGLSSIRAAVAYANGLAFALGVQIFPVTSLELMAIAAGRGHQGPVLCLKRGQGGNTYAGLFADGEPADLRHGPLGEVVAAMAGGLGCVRVAGAAAGDVAGLLPDVAVTGTGIAEADVAVLYRAARAAMADPERLVPAASPLNEASRIFHEPAGSRPGQRRSRR